MIKIGNVLCPEFLLLFLLVCENLKHLSLANFVFEPYLINKKNPYVTNSFRTEWVNFKLNFSDMSRTVKQLNCWILTEESVKFSSLYRNLHQWDKIYA